MSNVIELIDNTPLVEITRLDTGPCRLFVKLESQNPGGSIKDRIAGLSAVAEWRDVARLAFRDYSHEWHISGCFILGLAAVLAPLLVLFGLKYGLVTSMLTALAENPENRELKHACPSRGGVREPAHPHPGGDLGAVEQDRPRDPAR